MGKREGGGGGRALGGQIRRPFALIWPIVVHQLLFFLSFSTVTAFPADLSWPINNNLWPNGNEFGDGDDINGGGGAFSPFAFPQSPYGANGEDIGNAETNVPLTFLAGSANSAGHFGTSGDGTDFDSVLDAFEANGKNTFGTGNQFEWAGNREEETAFTPFPTLIPADKISQMVVTEPSLAHSDRTLWGGGGGEDSAREQIPLIGEREEVPIGEVRDLSMMRSIPVFGTYGRGGTALTGTGDDGIGIGTLGNEKSSPAAAWRQANCFTAGGCVDQLPNNHQQQAAVASSALIGGGAAAAASYLGGSDGTASYKFPMIEEAAAEETFAGQVAQGRRQGNTYGGFMGGNAEVDGSSPMYPLGAANAFGGFVGEGAASGGMFGGIGAANTAGGVEQSAEDWDDDLMAGGGGGGAMALGGGGNAMPWIAGGAETRRTDSEERQRYSQYLESIQQRYGVMLPRGGNNAPQQPFGNNNPLNGDGSAALPPQQMSSSLYSGLSPQGMLSVDGNGTPNQRGPMPSNVWPVSSSRQVGTSANILSPKVPSPPASASFGTFSSASGPYSSATNQNPFIAGSVAVDRMGCAESARTNSLIMDKAVERPRQIPLEGEIGGIGVGAVAGVQSMPQQRNGGGPNYGSILSGDDGTFAVGNHPAWPSGMALIEPTGQNGIWKIAGERETDGVQQQSQQQQTFLLEQSLLLALLTTRAPASSQATVTAPTKQTTTTTTTAQTMTTTTTTTTTSTTSTSTDQERMERTPPIQQSTTSVQALSQQIRRLPAVLYADSRKADSRQLEMLMRDTYGLPLVTFYADKLGRAEAVEANLAKLTAHRGMPYLFICGTFIGSLEHIQNYHQQRQMPRLVEYVCSGEADKGDEAEESTRMTDKRRAAGRKRRRESKKRRKGKKRKETNRRKPF